VGPLGFSFVLLLLLGTVAAAQSNGGPPASPPARQAGGSRLDVPRDTEGRVLVRATRVSEPVILDGRLTEDAYARVEPFTGLVQQDPDPGAAVTERTEVWVLYDERNVYVSCRCWDEHPELIVANDMRRDSNNMSSQDHFAAQLDTFFDRRTGMIFSVTPAGGLRDGASTDDRANFDWNGVWDARAGYFEGGWVAEIAIPFKTLRYNPGREQTWGIQLRRRIGSKNETAYLTEVPSQWGPGAINRLSMAGTLVGVEAPAASVNLEVKPYVASRLTTDEVTRPAVRNDVSSDVGVDVKYGVTKSLTADFTYNTDFAQAEVDEVQVNLTRFALSYPEKREFFLEGQGLFAFGNMTGGNVFGGGGGTSDAPTVFYSRRIGLSGSRLVPVIAGARLTGKAGTWSVGGLNMTTDEVPGVAQTSFTVARLRRDILRRSSIGGVFTSRSVSAVATGANHVWGLDALLGFYQNVNFSGYVAQSLTEGRRGKDLNYDAQFNYTGDTYGLSVDRLVVEENFNPEVGLIRRENFRRNFLQGRYSPRTTNNAVVRRWTYQGSWEYITDNANVLESRDGSAEFRADFQNSDNFNAKYSELYEFVPRPFSISGGAVIPVGSYSFNNLNVGYTGGQQRRVSGSGSFDIGGFYDGDKKTATLRGRVEITPRLGVEPNVSVNWIDLPQGRFTTNVVSARTTFTATPRMFVAALVQYSSSTSSLSTNLRFRWEYQPGSEMFIVYSEGRSTLPSGATATHLENRGFVVKVNRLFRF
jgi:hypothetical protein